MSVATKPADNKNLRDLVPLNALSEERFAAVSRKIVIEEVRKGRYLFRQGERDNQSIYLLDGKISLLDTEGKVTAEVEAGTDISRYPIANQQPRPLSARAVTKTVIARIDSGLLEVFLAWDQETGAEVTEITADDNEDWMTRILQSEVFENFPPAVIQRLLMKMKPLPVRAGQEIIAEGEEGDYFYTIHKGECAVTRRETPGGAIIKLAELRAGDSFGEDALVTSNRRNATVTMLSDGVLMRLGKEDFAELLQKQLVKYVDFKTATGMADAGAVWIDVRSAEEYEAGAFEDSVNIPLSGLRSELGELVFNAKYITCCDTSLRSTSAAFLLSHRGFEVYVLEGGLGALDVADSSLPRGGGSETADDKSEGAGGEELAAEQVIDFNRNPEPAARDADNVEGAGTGQIEELASLRHENGELRAVLDSQQAKTVADDVRQAEIERLKGELREARARLSTLQEELQDAATSARDLRGQYDTLERENQERVSRLEQDLGQSGERYEQLRAELEAGRQHAESLQAERDAAQEKGAAARAGAESALQEHKQRLVQLSDELERSREQVAALEIARDEQLAAGANADNDRAALVERLERQRHELEQSRARVAELEAALATASEAQRAATEQFGTEQTAQSELLERRQAELDESRQRVAELEAALDAAREEGHTALEQAETEKAAQAEALERLREKLGESRLEIDRLTGAVGEAHDKAAGLQKQLDELAVRHASELAEHREREAALQQELDAAAVNRQDLEQQRAALQEDRDGTAERLAASEAAQGETRSQLEVVERKLEAALDEKQRLESQQAALQADIENLKADKEAAAEALAQLQGEWEVERDVLREEITTANRRTEEHDTRLVEYQEAVQRERAQIEAGHGSRLAALNGHLEQQEARIAQLQQEQAVQAEHYQALVGERDAILVKLNESDRQCAAQQQDIASLNTRLNALTGSADEKVQALSEQLEYDQQQIMQAGQQAAEQVARIESLQGELVRQDEEKQALLAQAQTLQQENEALRQGLLETEERARLDTDGSQEAISQVYEDLTRKNEIEKELQGQIERLRKKLEQSSQDLQAARNEVRESTERFRDELNAERRARDEERVQLAARQKELKGQLAAVAKEHEEVLSAQEGLLARARSTGRDEERARLQQLQNERLLQAEEQVARLQAELKQARQEMVSAIREERERLAAEQAGGHGQQAEVAATVARLESQLRESVQERDALLEEQRRVHEQLNALRAEVEVARGLMGSDADEQVKDAAKLRTELDEARKNIEIAVRLRTEAETQRDKALQAMEALRHGKGESVDPDAPLEIPSLDDVHPILEARLSRERKVRRWVRAPLPARLTPPPAGQSRPASVTQSPSVGKSRPARGGSGRVGKGIVVLAGMTVAGLVIWLALQGELPLPGSAWHASEPWEAPVASTAPSQPAVAKRESAPVQSVAEATEPPAQTPAASRVQDTGGASRPASGAAPETAAEADVGGQEAADVVEEPHRVSALRTFRDRLKGGGRGPQMVELPAADFLMGSAGTSMNFDERPQHRVELGGYSISAHEVSFAEYDRFAHATGRRLPYDEGWGRGDQPVINVSWKEARAYAGWLSKQTGHSYRLPSEAQWEFAARGGTGAAYWWDSHVKTYPANCFDCGNEWDGRRTTAVGSFSANAYGLHDTAGNAQEWVEDCYVGSYEDAPADGSARQMPRCSQRVVRGGAYTSPLDSLRSTKRAQYDQDTRLDNLGFRVVRID